jgi:hypothetical protein
MKSLAHIHLKALWRLAETHGNAHFLAAATRAQDYRRYSAQVLALTLFLESSAVSPGLEARGRV